MSDPNAIVVKGCGGSGGIGRMKLELSTTDSNVTFADFASIYFADTRAEGRPQFRDYEWRFQGGPWQKPFDMPDTPIGLTARELGENIIEVRAKAGAKIETPIVGYGPTLNNSIVVQHFFLVPDNPGLAVTESGAYFIFSSGEGCGRILPPGYNEPHGFLYDGDGRRIM